ncbi:MAG: hypothetical protein M0P31_17185 [Solirubrobacteraceae bacterium]|nr:hypothetical protein [Solirubrobacteraceae bacterium]
MADLLDDAIASATTLRRTTVYRGIRSLRRTFGVDRAEDLPDLPSVLAGYTEDLVLAKPGEPPRTAGALLNRLGVLSAPPAKQRPAVARWMAENPAPSDGVLRGLRRKGLIDASTHRAA